MPVNPTDTQLAARLNPTPSTIYTPTGGLFRGIGDYGTTIYNSQGQSLNLLDPTFGLYDSSITGAGAQSAAALQTLKDKYGIDFNSLPQVNIGDYIQNQTSGKGGLYIPGTSPNGFNFTAGNLQSFFPQGSIPTPATLTPQQINTQPNQIATPQQQAAAAAATQQQLAGDQGMNVTQNGATPLANAQTNQASPQPTTGYMGPSIVDYLNSVGQPSDFASRAQLAAQQGITNYTGTAAQNTQLLNMLRGGSIGEGASASSTGITNPSGELGSSGTLGEATSQNDALSGAGVNLNDPYAGLDPVAKQVKMYTDAYNALGLSTIKQQFDDYQNQYQAMSDELAQKKADIQANPWLSQGLVDKEQEKLDKVYQTKLDTLTHLMTLTDSLYKQGQAQVDHMVSDANADIKATNDLAQKQIDAANAIAKDNVVQSINGEEWLINKTTGAKVANLGPSTTQPVSLADKEALYLFEQQNKQPTPKNPSTTPNSLDTLFGSDTGSAQSQQYAPSLYDQVGNQIDWSALGL